jgi:oligoendopeptidase F
MPWIKRGRQSFFYAYMRDQNDKLQKSYVGKSDTSQAAEASQAEQIHKSKKNEDKNNINLFDELISEFDAIRERNNRLVRYALIRGGYHKNPESSKIRRLPYDN